jgi:hypothetical protein
MKSTLQPISKNHLESCLPDWEKSLRIQLPLYGHRNWVVVADSAYPAPCRQGIETIVAPSDLNSIVLIEMGIRRTGCARQCRPD